MAQADGVVANGTGSAVRADINGQLAALFTNHSGSTEPATTFAFQTWADTNTNTFKLRNSSNDGWVQLARLDGQFDAKTFNSNVTLNAQSDLRFADSDSSNWVAFQAPATVASNVTWTLPSADGTADQALVTNGSGTLSWADSGGGDNITEGNTSAEVVDTGSDGHFKVITEGSERTRIDSSGRLLVGTSTAVSGVASSIQTARSTGGFIAIGNSATFTGSGTLGQIGFNGNQTGGYGFGASITAEGDGTWSSNTDCPSRLVFATTADSAPSPTERLRITSNGTLRLYNSPGIDFSQIQSPAIGVASETLDGYEEGTFTPSINSGYTVSYDVANGRYVKVGALVAIWLDIDTSSHSGSSGDVYAYINGLPFTVKNSGFIDTGFSVGWIYNLANNVDHCYADGGQTRLVLLGPNSGGSRTHWTPAQVWGTSGDRRISISGVYYTDS